MLFNEGWELLFRNALDDDRGEIVAAVRIRVFRTGREVECALMSDNVEREILSDDSIAATGAGQAHDCAPGAQARSVVQQMFRRQRRTVIGQFGNVFPHWIV